jgi:hypothetical protein
VLIDSTKPRATVFRKGEDFWYIASEAADMAGSIRMETISFDLQMTEIYEGVNDLGA